MTENKAGEQQPPSSPDLPINTDIQTRNDWHPQGVWWLIAGGVGVPLLAGYLSLLLFERPALRESTGVIVLFL